MDNRQISETLSFIQPNAEWKLVDNDYENIEWFSNEIEKPSIEELKDAYSNMIQVKNLEAEAKAAQRQALLSRLGITEEEARILLGGN